jgi:uncharacterized protein involved in type VI secretion and phage assembly
MSESDLPQQLLDWVRGHYFGKYRGLVTDNADQTSRGRLRVKVPSLLGDLEVWAMPCVPYAGAQVGFYSLPEAQTGVWVEFEGGDLSYPVWTGCFWADNEIPDQNSASIKIWKTEKQTIRLDDDADELKLENSSQCSQVMASDIQIQFQQAKQTVSNQGVTGEMSPNKVEITGQSVSVNSGALEVV